MSDASEETWAADLEPIPVATSAPRFSHTLVDMRPAKCVIQEFVRCQIIAQNNGILLNYD